MNSKISFKFALKNLKANKVWNLPYVIATSLMMAMVFIMTSLANNEYVTTRHQQLPVLIFFGIVVVVILSAVFIIYGNNFIVKRRNKEFALYGVLGLEKRHIRKIVFIESFIMMIASTVASIIGGYVFGKLAFLGINKLMKSTGTTLMEYNFSKLAAIVVAVMLLAIFFFLCLYNTRKIGKASPIELLNSAKKIEQEPKAKWLLTLIGLGTMGAGYYMALTVDGVLESLSVFFIAVILVIIGTYLLFMTAIVTILKALKKKKNFYYKTDHFLFISGMISRMKSNSVGLAGIAIVCTCIVVVLSTTLTAYSGLEGVVDSLIGRDYSVKRIVSLSDYDQKQLNDVKKEVEDAVNNNLKGKEKVEDFVAAEEVQAYAAKDGNKFNPVNTGSEIKGKGHFMFFYPLSDYNKLYGTNYKLDKDQVLAISNVKKNNDEKTMELAGKKYEVKKLNENMPSKIAVESYMVVVPDGKAFWDITNYYNESDDGQNFITIEAEWDIKNAQKDYYEKAKEYLPGVESRVETTKMVYELNGGFLFLGIVVATVFLLGNILMAYYKQISEAYEDRDSIQIMKKVGLQDSMIRKTARNQIIWMFLLPLIVAAIHSLGASRMMSKLLMLFGVNEYITYFGNLAIVMGIFALVYLIIFAITSKMYYKIVK